MRRYDNSRSDKNYSVTPYTEEVDTKEDSNFLDSNPLLSKLVSRQPKASKRAAVRCNKIVATKRNFDPVDYIVVKTIKEKDEIR